MTSGLPFNSQLLPRDALVALCQELVRTPSVNGEHTEQAVAKLAADFAASAGLWVSTLAAEPERLNLLVRAGPDRPADLLLVAHLDTVGIGDKAAWRFPPFGGELADGRIYGRGAADTKGGLVAALAALLLVHQLPAPEQPTVLLAAVPDEESGATGRLGIRFLHERGLLSGRGAIYCYPGNQKLILGHRGVLRLTIETVGRAQHTGGTRWQDEPVGQNAVTTMAAILQALEALRFPESSSGLFAPYRTVITPTTITGGSGVSIVPDRCVATVDVRLIPATSRETVLAAVQRVLDEVATSRAAPPVMLREDVALLPTEIPADEPVVRAAQQAAQAVLGRPPRLAISGPANESYLLNELGIPTCIIGPEGENVHAADEYVVVSSLFDSAAIYAHTALLLRAATTGTP